METRLRGLYPEQTAGQDRVICHVMCSFVPPLPLPPAENSPRRSQTVADLTLQTTPSVKTANRVNLLRHAIANKQNNQTKWFCYLNYEFKPKARAMDFRLIPQNNTSYTCKLSSCIKNKSSNFALFEIYSSRVFTA